MFVVASLVDADALLASARDTPAIPNADKALLRRLLFEERLDMPQFSHQFGHIGPLSRGRLPGGYTLNSACGAPFPAGSKVFAAKVRGRGSAERHLRALVRSMWLLSGDSIN